VWATVANDVLAFDASQPFLDGPRCQSKLDALKKKYDAWNRIKGRSGFGWDNERGVPTAPEDVWETAIQVSILEPCGARLLTVRGRKLRSSKSSGTHHFRICKNLAKSWTVSEPLASGLSIPVFLLSILFLSIRTLRFRRAPLQLQEATGLFLLQPPGFKQGTVRATNESAHRQSPLA
jgi:hypothetical protein